MIRDAEHHDERYEDEPVAVSCRNCGRTCERVYLRDVLFLVCPSCNLVAEPSPEFPAPEPEPAAPWADFEHVYHEHDERL